MRSLDLRFRPLSRPPVSDRELENAPEGLALNSLFALEIVEQQPHSAVHDLHLLGAKRHREPGRCVRAFLSDTDLHEHLAVETFVLGEPVEDMAGFEREGARPDSAQEISDQSERERAFKPPET